MVERTGLSNPKAIEVLPHDWNIYEITSRPGDYVTISLPANIRIGYRF